MQCFLNDVQARVPSKPLPMNVSFVIGNESCDLDSAVCSLVYAYFLSWSNKLKTQASPGCHIEENASNEDLFIPMLNILQTELSIKTEVVYFLKKNNIRIESIICRDSINIETFINSSNVKFHLVDHHILTENLKGLESHVSSILDHRPKDTINWKYSNAVKSDLTANGSCATSVCFEIMKSDIGKDFLERNKNAANLLYGTIVLDTANFLPAAKRAVALDFEMAALLESILGISDTKTHREQLFSELFKARTDLSSLTSFQLLRRDMKIVSGIPVPGLAMLVEDFLQRNDWVDALKQFCQDHKVNTILLIGLIIENGKVLRDLAIFSIAKSNLHLQIVNSMCESTDPHLQLVKTPLLIDNVDHFQQKNIEASRKQIVPIIKRCITL